MAYFENALYILQKKYSLAFGGTMFNMSFNLTFQLFNFCVSLFYLPEWIL